MSKQEFDIASHLAGRDAAIHVLYKRFVELIEACGPFEYVVGKTAVTFKGARRLFAGVVPKARSLDGFLVLQWQVEDPRVRRSVAITQRLYNNYFRVAALDQFEGEFVEWVQAAYAVGDGQHR